MGVSFILAVYFQVIHPALGFSPIANDFQFLLSVGLTTYVGGGNFSHPAVRYEYPAFICAKNSTGRPRVGPKFA